jgi:hypothetical protein
MILIEAKIIVNVQALLLSLHVHEYKIADGACSRTLNYLIIFVQI